MKEVIKMTNKKVKRLTISILCMLLSLCLGFSAFAASLPNDKAIIMNREHISDEAFVGYEGLETTVSGKVGFNYDLITPDKEKVILIGFNPYLAKINNNYDSTYKIGQGWHIKLPYLDITNKVLYQSDGYEYDIKEEKNGYVVDYPGISNFTAISEGFCFKKADGSKEIYNRDGKIKRIIDAFANETTYEYSSGTLTKIIYPDNSFVTFERVGLKVVLKYTCDNNTAGFVTFNLLSNMNGILLDTIEYDTSNLKFNYSKTDSGLILSTVSIENKYYKTITYNKNNTQVQSINTLYDDGLKGVKNYYYDAQGRVSKMVDEGFAEEQYKYVQKSDGSLVTETTKIYNGNSSVDKKTMNKYGQLIQYEQNNTVLTLKYNKYNKVQQEKENNLIINYSYNPQGEITLVEFPDGKIIKYDYYSNGQLQKKTSSEQTIYYTPQGEVKKITSSNQVLFDSATSNPLITQIQRSIGTNISVLYNINSYVGVTNYHTYYGLPQNGFNCYSYAIGKYERIYDPGYFSKRNLSLVSFSGIKLNVEQDMKSLSRGIYDCNVNDSIGVHSWKIALRIRHGEDYHFMKKSRNMSWGFKAGKGGPVMEVLNGKNPSNITWDQYYKPLFSSKYKVYKSSFYNSQIAYMMIRD